MSYITLSFLIALAADVVLNLWLYYRHSHYVEWHKNSVPTAFAEYISLDNHQKAADYTVAKIRLEYIDLALKTVVIVGWTVGGGLEYIFNLCSKFNMPPIWSEWLAIIMVLLIGMLIDLPLSLWRTFFLEQRFGFNNSSLQLFFQDLFLAVLLGIFIGSPLVLAILWLMKQMGGLWWLYAWLVWTIFTLFMLWAYPTFIDPLFNRFIPLEAGELRSRIEALLAHCGFSSQGVFMMDSSRRSAHSNAYFTGMGKNKRIVLFDTLVKQLTIEELEAVLAHELGHYRHRHVQIRLLLNAVVTFGGFALLGWLAEQPAFYQSLGLQRYSDGGILLLFTLVIPIFAQFLLPVINWLMRHQEYQADTFSIVHTNSTALIGALVKLYRDNAGTLTPDPLFSAFNDSHPPAALRIEHINSNRMQQQRSY